MSTSTNTFMLEPPVGPGGTDLLSVLVYRRRRGQRTAALVCFAVVVAMANAATFWLGLVPVGFGLSATAGTLGVGLIASCADWLRDLNSRWLVAVATLLSCATAGPVGLAWGIAYLIAGVVGSFTWRRLDELGANNALVLAALCLTSLVDTVVYVWLLAGFIPVTVPGQMLGKAETVIITAVLYALGRAVWRRLRRRPDTAKCFHAQSADVHS